jgi:hypothetical protein
MASTKTLVASAVSSRKAFIHAMEALTEHCRVNRIKVDTLRPIVMEQVAAYYKVGIITMTNGKEKLDSEATSYEAARKCMNRVLTAAYGKKKTDNKSSDPIGTIVAGVTSKVQKGAMTKAQVRRLIAALNNLL